MSSSKRNWLGLAIAGATVMAACGSSSGSGSNFGSPGGISGASSGAGNVGDDGGGYGEDAATTGGNGQGSSGSGTGPGGAASSSGTGPGGAGSGSGAASSSGITVAASDGGTCNAPVASGAIPLTNNYLASSVIAMGGYAYAYTDGMGSTACLDANALCGTGTTAIANSTGTIWGAGIGFNLNQAVATGSASPAVNTYATTGAGIAYSLSDLPSQGMRIVIDDNGTDYCATIATSSGAVAWGSFNTKCWDDSGTYLPGPPTATHINFQVTADGASTPFSVCVTSVSFPTSISSSSSGGGSSGGSSSGGSSASSSSSSGSGGTGGTCDWTSGPSSGTDDGELTCYWFSQGTSMGGGCPSYKTYCGYCGTESGSVSGTCPSSDIDTITSGISTSYWAAFPSQDFGQGTYCGMCVNISYGGKSIVATIVDRCGSCEDSDGHIDLGASAAIALGVGQGSANGDPKSGVTWYAVACPVTGDISAFYNNGSSSQIYFENVAFPVASATAGGVTGTQSTAFWSFGGNLVAGQSVTLTDALGDTITGTIPTTSGGSIGAQFPVSSSTSGTCN